MKASFVRLAACIFLAAWFGGHQVRANEVAQGADAKFDVVDVSFLLPPSDGSIHVAGREGARPILTKTLFDKFEDFIKRGHPGIDDPYHKLIVTAFRFDPCGPVYPRDWDIGKCVLPNIRIIGQVYESGTLSDAALHMVFVLGVNLGQPPAAIQRGVGFDPSVRTKVVAALSEMKRRNEAAGIVTNGVPVGIHPAFSGENQNSQRSREFAKEFEELLLTVASEDEYFTTAVMFTADPSTVPDGELDGRERWVWQKANIVKRGPSVPLDFVFGGIPGADPTQKEQSLTANFESRGGVKIEPPSAIVNGGLPDMAISAILRDVSEFEWGRLQEAINVTDTLDNPDVVFVQNDDCAGCHLSSAARSYALRHPLLTWVRRPNAFRFDPSAALTAVLAPADATALAGESYRVMNLAYFKGRPAVSQRVINESLQAAHLLNCSLQAALTCSPR